MAFGKELLGEYYTADIFVSLLAGIFLIVRAFLGWSKQMPPDWDIN